jgi:hypothetical protein
MDETDKALLTPVYSKGQLFTLVAVLAILAFVLGMVVGIAIS